ncbi:ATPase [Oceanicola sp. 22II-s10i]|uniref:AAA family ATPase n=1 Tax=Oceanicola sp. 22II-s10i TaxID=1317116 RepID=UPI000B6868EB|nr:AAA family ATPase [Oceanicola sp. 22II-s10i]OWU86096.1 ATPase [Oceanicola sp. 22II-s10i]
MSHRFFVVTGGPGAGKTSLIRELARRGVQTAPESGRAVIREEQARGGTALPWGDRLAYAMRMLERDLTGHASAGAGTGPVVFDPGVPDVLGYLALCGLDVPEKVARVARETRYNPTVFFAPYWGEIFTQDAERRQDRAEAMATAEIMAETYARLGYQIVELPRADIAARAEFVLARLHG